LAVSHLTTRDFPGHPIANDEGSMQTRLALSRVNVLIGLLIGILLVGLFLAGLVKIRESANLMKCRNNFKQLGLAVHNYHDTNDQFPPLTDQGEGAPTGRGLPSVFANLIGYIEGTNYSPRRDNEPQHYLSHTSVTFTVPGKGEIETWHGGVANWISPSFLDPADATANRLHDVPMTLPDGSTGYYATGSYAANGLVPWGTGVLTRSFPRGTENTILMGERPQVCRTEAGEAVYNLWGLGFYSPHMPAFACLTPNDPPGLWSTGQMAPVTPIVDESFEVRIGRQDATAEAPGDATPMQRIRSGRPCDPRLPGGPHSTGMQVLMADGSVRVFSWDTPAWVFWWACAP
jgi:prepilin-type processing-associated H-X9-DG protein